MTFVCQCCGDCCSTMGEIITIREQIRPFEFRIGFTTGEERVVSVDPGWQGLFRIQPPEDRKSIACPFLMQIAPGERICAVHASRPPLCRSYLCFRILIVDHEGKKAGRVPFASRSITTENAALLDIWNRTLRDLPVPDDDLWEQRVEEIFTREGYRVIR